MFLDDLKLEIYIKNKYGCKEFSEVETINYAIESARDLLCEKKPYVIDKRVDGEVVILSSHFGSALVDVLSYNCTGNMYESEKELYFGYIKYSQYQSQNNTNVPMYANINDIYEAERTKVYEAIDAWLIDELLGNPHPEYEKCE